MICEKSDLCHPILILICDTCSLFIGNLNFHRWCSIPLSVNQSECCSDSIFNREMAKRRQFLAVNLRVHICLHFVDLCDGFLPFQPLPSSCFGQRHEHIVAIRATWCNRKWLVFFILFILKEMVEAEKTTLSIAFQNRQKPLKAYIKEYAIAMSRQDWKPDTSRSVAVHCSK